MHTAQPTAPLIPNVATRGQGWAGAEAVGLPPRFGEASGHCLGEQDSDLNSTRRDSNAEGEEHASMTVKKSRGFCFVFRWGVRYVALSSSEMMDYQGIIFPSMYIHLCHQI